MKTFLHSKAEYKEDISIDQDDRIDSVRNQMSVVYTLFENILKRSRETELAMQKLEEAQFWAIKGISRENSDDN